MPSLLSPFERDSIWNAMTKVFPRVPRGWSIQEGSKKFISHRTSILDIKFSPDGTSFAIAGGGRIPGCDSTIRIASAKDLIELKTCSGHVCGIYNLAFDARTGFLASASEDYCVILWNLEKPDAIFLTGGDDIVKHRVAFSDQKPLIAIGESEAYDESSSIYVIDLSTGEELFRERLEKGMGIDSLAISADGSILYYAISDFHHGKDSQISSYDLSRRSKPWTMRYAATHFSDLKLILNESCLAASVMVDKNDLNQSGIDILDATNGTRIAERVMKGIGSDLSVSPLNNSLVCAYGEGLIECLSIPDLKLITSYPPAPDNSARYCSVQYFSDGKAFLVGDSRGVVRQFHC